MQCARPSLARLHVKRIMVITIIMCIVHAHVAFGVAYIIMPNMHPPPPKKKKSLLLLLLLSSTSFMCTLFRRYPTRVPICVCVCERAIAIRTLHTRQFIIIITVRIRFLFICFFFPSSCYLVFLIRTAVDNNSTTFTRSFEWKIGPSGNGGGSSVIYIYIYI